ncbi:MAG: hypothetical protein KGR48_03440 [Alphaproteobacteria bacterium]|nr:hypothetical protein [Alphaproteobacteria bacterium]MBU6471148.1 hypothetical protein [Alphaproteobacteria bacterium]MDE2013103.1 hypothetical protein [Alphaproteobacteria bacterium]MDE2074398.1 hypothetical protein [Alphaproteobacteria bacterium]MDE2351923.1 hypothetical protein [Alphaproteobacteria bacterium]
MTKMGADSPRQTDEVHQHSGWLIPVVVFVVTAGLSALFLLYYLVPAPTSFIEEHPAPTSHATPVSLAVGGLKFTIPADYVVYRSARTGGRRKELALITTFPDFRGYNQAESQTFASNASDSPVIYILVREEQVNLSEQERLERIYLGYVTDARGKPGPFDLTQYTFRDDTGYRGEDLFVGHMDASLVVMRCVRFSLNVPSPSCLRDKPLGKDVALSYRFKRANLGSWREIGHGVDALMRRFVSRTH